MKIGGGSKDVTSNFVPCPAGSHHAVLVDVVDLGMVKVEWQGNTKEQHKVRLVWQVSERMEGGKRYIASQRYTASLYDRAALRPVVEALLCRPCTTLEVEDGVEMDALIGTNCIIGVQHRKDGDKTFANVKTVTSPLAGMPVMVPEDYVRVQDREPKPAAQPSGDEPPPWTDADVPFPGDDDIPF